MRGLCRRLPKESERVNVQEQARSQSQARRSTEPRGGKYSHYLYVIIVALHPVGRAKDSGVNAVSPYFTGICFGVLRSDRPDRDQRR
jgi:hypothetical protein